MSICMTAPNYLQKLLSGMEVTAKKEHSRTSNENQTHNHGTVLFRVFFFLIMKGYLGVHVLKDHGGSVLKLGCVCVYSRMACVVLWR